MMEWLRNPSSRLPFARAIVDWFRRHRLIRSAQRKVRQDLSARRVTCDEWNALAYRPLNRVREEIRKAEGSKT